MYVPLSGSIYYLHTVVPSDRPVYGLAWYVVTVVTSFHVTATQKGAHDLSYGNEEVVSTILPHCTNVLNMSFPILMPMNE